ncbi:MAG: hypothetical protein ACOC4C_03000 [Fibrobacterota bacterium]
MHGEAIKQLNQLKARFNIPDTAHLAHVNKALIELSADYLKDIESELSADDEDFEIEDEREEDDEDEDILLVKDDEDDWGEDEIEPMDEEMCREYKNTLVWSGHFIEKTFFWTLSIDMTGTAVRLLKGR